MNERMIIELATKANLGPACESQAIAIKKFAELIVKEMCGMMARAEDDAYHCFDASERPTEYIEWLRDWQEQFTTHFGVEE